MYQNGFLCIHVHTNRTQPDKESEKMQSKRAPHGDETAKPIAIRLLPQELSAFKALAEKEERPLANMARLIVVRALNHHQRTGQLPT